jgi:hypothetical protein
MNVVAAELTLHESTLTQITDVEPISHPLGNATPLYRLSCYRYTFWKRGCKHAQLVIGG